MDDILVLDCEDRGPAGRIAYVSTEGAAGKHETWIMDSDGRNRRKLTAKASSKGFAAGAFQPHFSRYGELVAHGYKDPYKPEDHRLGTVKIDGTKHKIVPKASPTPYGLGWSPGDEVFYVQGVSKSEGLWIVPPNGGTPAKLWTGDSGWPVITGVAHHPMDRETAYVQSNAGASGKICWIPDLGPTKSTCITAALGGQVRSMDWSAAGDKLVWVQMGSTMDVLVLPTIGSGKSSKVATAGDLYGVSFGAGDETIYFTGKDATNKLHIFRVDEDGKNEIQLTSGAAESMDPHFYPYLPNPGGVWRTSAHNPVFKKEASAAWPVKLSGSPDVIWNGKEYLMYFHGCTNSTGGCKSGIGMASSPDGIAWTQYDKKKPAIAAGSTAFNIEEAYSPTVVYDGSGYHMWYTACKFSCDKCGIAYATSSDGKAWTTHHNKGQPVLTNTQSWEGIRLMHPSVIKDGATFHMWYSTDGCTGAKTACNCTKPYRTGYARSTDGKTWIKHAANPVFGPGSSGSYDANMAAAGDVVKIGATFHMWYAARANSSASGTIGHATSADGISWTRDKAVVFSGITGWSANTVHLPAVVRRGSFMQMWVNGYDAGNKVSIGYFAVAP